MRINHNVGAMIGQEAMRRNNAALARSVEKLSTGLRINRASDDAAGLSVSESLRARVRCLNRARENASDGISALQIYDSNLGVGVDIRQRMRELAVQSANDTMTTTDRDYLDNEFQELNDEFWRIMETRTLGNLQIVWGANSFGGVSSNFKTLHIGAGADPATDQMTIALDASGPAHLSMQPGLADISTAASALNAISRCDNTIQVLTGARGHAGAYINALEFQISALGNEAYNTQDAESRIRDVDFASETTQFTRSQILSQSATSMLAQANQVPQGVLGLLSR